MLALHVPDGYVSPATCAAAFAVMIPAWAAASARLRTSIGAEFVPSLAFLSVLSFIVMMFNIPVVGGTTAHAIGGVLIAIVLGPWAAILGVSIALFFQAILAGDGGVLAFGVNALNLALIGPVVGWWAYRAISAGAALSDKRRLVAAGVAAYLGANASGLVTAIELGLQPVLFQRADGVPLYAPYPLSQTIPAIMLAHLSVAGLAEVIVTVAAMAFLVRTSPALLRASHAGLLPAQDAAPASVTQRSTRLSVGVMGLLVLLTPLGLLAPGEAYAEQAPQDIRLDQVGLSAVPEGLSKFSGFWSHTVMADYAIPGVGPAVGYLISAGIGVLAVGAGVFALSWVATRLLRREESPTGGATS